jgi:predicted nucleotidyltransferase
MPTKIVKRVSPPPTRVRPVSSRSRTPRVIDARIRPALARLKRTLRATYGKRFRGLYVYGSYARGDARPDSDVDTIVVLAGSVQPYQELDRLSQMLSNLCLQYDLLIATYPIPEAWLRERESPLFENIRREGVRI